jgi:hypothetical protein
MNSYARGMVAGLIATLVLSAIMVMKSMMGLMSQLDVIALISNMANNYMSLPRSPVTGWSIHFMVGILVYGLGFVLLHSVLPGRTETVKGISLAILGWAIMMLILMPMAGKGLLGLSIGIIAPIATFILHIIFGAVLGWTYAKLAHPHHRTA